MRPAQDCPLLEGGTIGSLCGSPGLDDSDGVGRLPGDGGHAAEPMATDASATRRLLITRGKVRMAYILHLITIKKTSQPLEIKLVKNAGKRFSDS